MHTCIYLRRKHYMTQHIRECTMNHKRVTAHNTLQYRYSDIFLEFKHLKYLGHNTNMIQVIFRRIFGLVTLREYENMTIGTFYVIKQMARLLATGSNRQYNTR